MTSIDLLLVEDSDDDAVLIVRQLRQDGLQVSYRRVETAAAATAALVERRPDVVISDYNLPTFSAEAALALLSASGLDVPFILVSGEVGEETAVALLRGGAHDFVLKDRLTRLGPAVRRELREAAGRRERQQAEAALRASEQRFRLLAEHAQDVIFVHRLMPQPELEYISPAVAAITGYRPEDLYQNAELLFSLVELADQDRFRASWWEPGPEPLVVRWRRADGLTVWTEQRAVSIRDETGAVVAVEGILRDITEQQHAEQQRQQMERQLRQSERLESLGQLAGGVAHDFNNLLAVINGYADLVTSALRPDDPLRADLDGISNAARRGADLTRQLLLFSRLEPSAPQTLDLNAVVADTETLLRRTIGEDLDFVTLLAPGPLPVTIDHTKLEQIILNLVVNARAAMPDGGRLTIATADVEAEPDAGRSGEIRVGQAGAGVQPAPPPGLRVRLTVADTGTGMVASVAEHAFDPFFTTKGPGKGTGLGLATVYGVVQEAGGEIRLWTEPGKGTAFDIYLPAAASAISAVSIVPDELVRGSGETILLVEDEAAVREITRRILTNAGYQVLEAANPAEALTRHVANGDIDALLTDALMPGMSGAQLIEQFHHTRPNLPTLVMSGYTAGTLPSRQSLPTDVPFIRKPFTAAALLHRLHEVLARADSAGAAPL
ncbi:MAG TPA: response regulator [Mycobacteriales bacterium]|nr:response regulator [Mycobacteriales bacterium]